LQKRTEEKARQLSEVAAAAPAAATDMASYLNKRSVAASEAITGGGDLVSDVSSGRRRLDSVKDEELPETLRKLAPEQRAAMLDEHLKTRATLNARLTKLVAQRDAFVAERRAKAPPKQSSFDRVVEETLKKQIAR
jgi:hypothetical protein